MESMKLVDRIELARTLDKERLALQKEVDALASQVAGHKEVILAEMQDLGAVNMSAPSKAWAKVTDKEVVHVKDWTKLYAFIVGSYLSEADHEQDVAMMMLQKRVADAVVKTFLELHELTPEQIGVELVTIDQVKLGG